MTASEVRFTLRDATRARHDAVDRLFGVFDLGTRAGYTAFLTAQAAAFLPVEAAIDAAGVDAFLDDWPQRRRGDDLRADLAALGVSDIPMQIPPSLDSEAAVLGAVYVLEGSRLGGAVLSRGLPAGTPARFLNTPGGDWRALLAVLDRRLNTPPLRQAAIAAAEAVFMRFEDSARDSGTPGS